MSPVPCESDLPFHRRTLELLVKVSLPTAAHWLVLAVQIPIFMELPYWFFYLHEQTVQWQWIGLAIIVLGLGVALTFSNTKPWLKLAGLILCGTIIQISLGFSLGKGLAGISDKMTNTGHVEFARVAIQQESMMEVAKQYEALAGNGDLGIYTPSKPPGSLLFYMVSERLANLGQPDSDPDQRLENLKVFASLIWPLLSYLVLIPMWFVGQSLLDRQGAFMACLFYLCIPSVNLINLHLDQVIYPCLAVLPVALLLRACIKRNTVLACASGMTFYLALYFSFGLALIALVITALFAIMLYKDPSRNWHTVLRLTTAMLAGMAIFDVSLRLWLRYDILTRYLNASAYHTNWKGWEGGLITLVGAGVTDVLEFSVWLGIPLSILFLGTIRSQASQLFGQGKRIDLYSALSFSVFAIFIILILFGHTKAETARLWLFLVPFICLLTSGFIQRRSYLGKRQTTFALLIVSMEFITTYLTLRHQDFR